MPIHTSSCTPHSLNELPNNPQNDVLQSRKRRIGMTLSAIYTTLILGLVVILSVERVAPHSALAGWLRYTPCSSSPLLFPKSSTKRQIRRLEDQEQEDDKDDEDNNNGEGGEDEEQDEEKAEEAQYNRYRDDDYYKAGDDNYFYKAADDYVAVEEEEEEEVHVLQTYPPGKFTPRIFIVTETTVGSVF
jgi:hypothetical protein